MYLHDSLSTLWGRERDVEVIGDWLRLDECRLVTISGVGGVGKTRLAIQLLSVSEDMFEGSFFIPLQAIRSKHEFISLLADTLQVKLVNQASPLSEILNWLSVRKILITLDNYEHLIAELEPIVLEILANTTGVKILITSREALNLKREYLHRLDGLVASHSVDAPAVRMFVDAAQKVNSKFDPDTQMDDMVQICELVDGIPLALQLASTWTTTLSCADIVAIIQEDYRNLYADHPDAVDRHVSIQACFDHSWKRLTHVEKNVFSRLTIFRGGIARSAALEVTGASVHVLRRLINKSLIYYSTADQRYYIHELLMQYGRSKLAEADDSEETMAKYLAYFSTMLHDSINSLKMADFATHKSLSDDKQNIINIWYILVDTQDEHGIAAVWEPIYLYFYQTGQYVLGESLFQYACEHLNTSSVELQLFLLTTQGWFKVRRGELDGGVSIMRKIPFDTSVSSKATTFYCSHYTYSLVSKGDYEEALKFSRTALLAAQSEGDSYYLSFTLYIAATVALAMKKVPDAQTMILEALEVSEEIDQGFWGTAYNLLLLGRIYEAQEKHEDALQALQRSQSIFKQTDDQWGIILSLSYTSRILIEQGDLQLARTHLRDALTTALEAQNISTILAVVLDTAYYVSASGENSTAIRLANFVKNHKAAYDMERDNADRLLSRLAQYSILAEQAAHQVNTLELPQVIQLLHTNLAETAAASGEPSFASLTARELEVLKLLATSLSTEEIAKTLVISKATLRTHIKRIYSKLDTHSRLETVNRARTHNLL